MPEPVINYYSIASFIANGQDDTYIIPFPFLERGNIYVYVNGVQIYQSDLDWTLSESQFKITSPIVTNDVIVVRRFTKQNTRLADYHNGSILTEQELNIVTKQLLYLIQELSDYRTAGLVPDPPPGQLPPNGEGEPSLIDDIIAQILGTQVFQNLLELITLTDINAEAIIQNSLSTHSQWSVNRLLDSVVEEHTISLEDFGITLDTIDAQIIDINNTIITNESATAIALDGIAVRFGDAESNILTLQTAFADSETATATLVQQLQAEIADNEALILSVESVSVTADSAMTARVDVMESSLSTSIANAHARIGTVEQTYVSETESHALIQDEISLWYSTNNFESLFASSSYISGISSTVTENTADISGITSYLVGTNADFNDPNTWDQGSLAVSFAGLQETVDVHADEIFAESQFRSALYAAFFPNGDDDDHTGMVSAMEQTWRTYVDEESALAERTDSLEVNQQPIFFRQTSPDPRSGEFSGTRFENGFPVGSMWHNTNTPTRLISYYWHGTNTPPYTPVAGDIYQFSGITGMWVRSYDEMVQTQGASIQSLQSAYSNLDAVGSIVETVLQSAVGDDINAIAETMESWFDMETGQMYSGWQVRINQYNNGVPTIAGIGLGMENDPVTGESQSNFIVMADTFSVIKPPTAEDLEGDLNPEDIFIPFIVNASGVAGEPDVIINGSMFVKNTLSAMDGFAGRFTFTDLDQNGYPVEHDGNYVADGHRLVLASDTNQFNESNSGSPFPGGSNPQKFWMWAGDGTMNHNNAVFYIDTDGNGFFGGQVLADNISGDISNIHSVDVTGGATASGSGWVQVAESGYYNPVGSRVRTPSVVVNVNMYGSGQTAGRARIEGRSKIGTTVGAWELIAEAPIYMPIGTTLTLAGTMAPTTGSVQIRSLIQRQETSPGDWQYPSSSYIKGVLQMLA